MNIHYNLEDIEWRPVVGYESLYEVSEYGDVRKLVTQFSYQSGYILKGSVNHKGYLVATLTNIEGKSTPILRHKLVALAWLGNRPNKMQINHIDQDKQNNHYSNLEYVTCKENIRQSRNFRVYPSVKGEHAPNARLSQSQVSDIRLLLSQGLTQKHIAHMYGVSQSTIWRISSQNCWKET